jgi:hypothetical protein
MLKYRIIQKLTSVFGIREDQIPYDGISALTFFIGEYYGKESRRFNRQEVWVVDCFGNVGKKERWG